MEDVVIHWVLWFIICYFSLSKGNEFKFKEKLTFSFGISFVFLVFYYVIRWILSLFGIYIWGGN